MSTFTIVLFIIAAILLIGIIFMYFWGKRIQKRQAEQQELVERTAQTVTMLIIDKKKLRANKSGLPQEMINQIPFYLRRSKMPIVKAKVGQRMMTFISDPTVYDLIPVKKEVKATLSGMYISNVKGIHGKTLLEPPKKGLRAKLNKIARDNRR